eukprot:CAMPEP_0204820964 /NCGR_PEP_ID=MMETSP1018-20131115/623_1 /ASSEMBLY_ACC=CAM_ASM_000518 /TAXON_ID=46462 /ORGANISM="Anophryoides haemophila, Strain AH6" /LENGTH=55 /DNA_ID=CAMNT_0051917841 /DNA_START=84 /DNA_END=251 /DNA_ORIENTATION=-
MEEEDQYEDDSSDDDGYEFGDEFEITLDDLMDLHSGQYQSMKCYYEGKDTIDWED